MKERKIKDNSCYSKEYLNYIPNITSMIADKTLKQLEREGIFVFPEIVEDAEDITSDQMIIRSINGCYWSSNVMGFLGRGDERLIIKSRFCSEEEDWFFQYLLERVLDFPNILDLKSDASVDNRLFNFLLFLFPYFLKTAMRKGVYKQYICRKYNDTNIKGIIDIDRHIKTNTPFVGNVAYNQREFSFDNDVMELVRHTIEFIKGKPYGKLLLAKVKEEVNVVTDTTVKYELYDRNKIIEQNKKNHVRHAYYREYLALQRLCLHILQHRRHQIGTGPRQVYGIVFDGAWLWEEYVNLLVADYFHHPRNKRREGAQRLFNNNIGIVYPDFISRDKDNRIIADAKYKSIDNIGNGDYLQVLAYMLRFDAKYSYFLYPEVSKTQTIKKLWLNSGTSYEKNVKTRNNVCVTKLGLLIPSDANSYDDFVLKIKNSEIVFQNMLSEMQGDIDV